jgi:hypothetical protein
MGMVSRVFAEEIERLCCKSVVYRIPLLSEAAAYLFKRPAHML